MASKHISEQKAYEDLANAIVIKAVQDYKSAYMAYLDKPNDIYVKARVNELQVFFNSDWYSALTTVDAEFLMNSIEKECKEKYALKKKIMGKRKETEWKLSK